MKTFVSLTADDFDKFLSVRQFVADTAHREVVYRRESSTQKGLVMSVYTTLSRDATAVRGCGQDAIRVTLTARRSDGSERGVKSFTPVLRVTSVNGVLDRIEKRLMEAALWARDEIRPCAQCRGPAYRDSGRCLGECDAQRARAHARRP